MLAQFLHTGGGACALKVGRGRTHHHANGGQPAAAQGAGGHLAYAQGQVPPFVYQVHGAVVQPQFHGNVGVQAAELGQVGGHVAYGKRDRRIQSQVAARLAPLLAYGKFHLLQIGENTLAAFQKQSARLGEGEVARTAAEQGNTQPRLQCGDMLGHHGGGQAQCPRCGAEVAKLHHLNENLHTGKTVSHGVFLLWWGVGVLHACPLLAACAGFCHAGGKHGLWERAYCWPRRAWWTGLVRSRVFGAGR